MTIKFIVDKFKEQDRKQLELIKKIVNEKPSKVDKNALFLKKFTLAILQQYNKKYNKNFKKEFHENLINLPSVPRKINLEFKMPQAPLPVKLDVKLNAPEKLEL